MHSLECPHVHGFGECTCGNRNRDKFPVVEGFGGIKVKTVPGEPRRNSRVLDVEILASEIVLVLEGNDVCLLDVGGLG